MRQLCTLSPIGIVGYGINEESIDRAVDRFDIDVIAADAGSMDPGPNYFGRGEFFADEAVVERDLRILLDTRERLDVPLLISTAGGSGSREHVDKTAAILERVAAELDVSFDLARIYTDVDREYLRKRVQDGAVSTLTSDESLTKAAVNAAEKIVAQVGPEPYMEALEAGADVVLGGRSIDLAPFAAIPLMEGYDEGLTFHLAKILECGTHATVSGSGDDALVGLLDDGFEVVPSDPERTCTTESVAAHTMYEKTDPFTIRLPGGEVDVSDCEFEQVGPRRVRVEGSSYRETTPYRVLVEGVEHRGFRTITPSGIRDQAVIENADQIIDGTASRVEQVIDVDPSRYELAFRKYGIDAVPLFEDGGDVDGPAELGITIDVVGETQEIADTVCGLARSTLLHRPFEGRVATGGNLALPYSPSDISIGPIYGFSIYHLVEPDAPTDIYTLEHEVVT